jgi:hypothetical protein
MVFLSELSYNDRIMSEFFLYLHILKQGRKRPLDKPKRMIERREREG